MCRKEMHTCPCGYFGHAKLYFVRNIVCPPEKECRIRNDPDERIIHQCRNFHIDGQPYVCAICRCEDVLVSSRATAEEVERALEHMDHDHVSELHHLAKQRRSGRRYFLLETYRTGYVDIFDEYSAEIYRTGNSFTEERDDLIPVPNDQPRGVGYEPDPSQPLYVPGTRRVRDHDAECRESCAMESQWDQRYNQALDDGGASES